MKATILLAEDDVRVREGLIGVLLEAGYRVLSASNGEEAVRLAREHAPDLILLDLAMPQMNGLDAAERLRSDPRTERIPLVAQTASTWFSTDEEGLRASGFRGLLVKPFGASALLAAVERALEEGAGVAGWAGMSAAGEVRARALPEPPPA